MLAERLRISEISSQSKVKIVVDIDGVMVSVDPIVIGLFNKKFGTDHRLKDITDWNIIFKWAKDEGLLDHEASDLENSYWYETPNIHRNALLMPGAYSLMKRLSESPLVDLNICTSRFGKNFKEATYLNFRENFPFINHRRISFGEKISEIVKIDPDICIEDSVSNAERIVEYTKSSVILVPHPYNYGKIKHERILEYNPEEVDLNNLPTLWPIYRLFRDVGII